MYQITYTGKDIYFWTDKGGTGKTNNALALKHRLDEKSHHYIIMTNQKRTLLNRVLEEGKELFILKKGVELPHIKNHKIFDLEGHAEDPFILEVIKNCPKAIVPTIAELSEIQLCVYSILEIQKYNPQAKILVLANRIKNDEQFELIENQIKKIGNFPIVRVNESRALPNMYIEKKSLKTMMEESGLNRWNYRHINESYNKITDFIINN